MSTVNEVVLTIVVRAAVAKEADPVIKYSGLGEGNLRLDEEAVARSRFFLDREGRLWMESPKSQLICH